MTLISCYSTDREFWGVFKDATTAVRVLFEALAQAYPDGAPERLSISYGPVSNRLAQQIGTLYEGPAK